MLKQKQTLFSLIFIGVLIALDQLSKMLMMQTLLKPTWHQIEVFSFFSLTPAWNKGVSFGAFNNMGANGPLFFALFSVAICLGLFYWMLRMKRPFLSLSISLIIGGAIGNIIDRLRFGAVFDFLDFSVGSHHWPAFNLADIFIVVGAFALILDGLRNKSKT